MRQGRFRRIAAALVFLSVAVVAGETPAIGLELPALPTQGAPELPAVSTLGAPEMPSLPNVPSLSTPPGGSLSPLRSNSPSVGQAPAGKLAIRPPALAVSPPNYTHGAAVNYETRARLAAHGKRGRGRAKAKRRRADAWRLRAVVAKLEACFYALSRRERRVIVLRAGLGGRRPHSRSEVARRLNISRRGVRRVERRALGRLRLTARRDGCTAGAGDGRAEAPSPTRLIGSVEGAAAVQPIVSRIPAPSLDFSAPSDLFRQAEPEEAPARLPRPDLAGDGGGAGDGWMVVAAGWGVALLVATFLIGFVSRLFRLRRQK
jgi:DNA-binding CsgD family transcriptional regulator